MSSTNGTELIHTQSAREDLEAYVGEYASDYDLDVAFDLLYEYADEWHDFVYPTGMDIQDALESSEK